MTPDAQSLAGEEHELLTSIVLSQTLRKFGVVKIYALMHSFMQHDWHDQSKSSCLQENRTSARKGIAFLPGLSQE